MTSQPRAADEPIASYSCTMTSSANPFATADRQVLRLEKTQPHLVTASLWSGPCPG